MGIETLIGAGASIIGGMMQSGAASDAADAQASSARDANAAQERSAARADATQRYFYDTNRADNSSFMNNGRAGNNQLAYLLGLNPLGANGGTSSANTQYLTRDQIRNQILPQYTTQGGTAGQEYSGGGGPFGTMVGAAGDAFRNLQSQGRLAPGAPAGTMQLTPYFDATNGPDSWDHVTYIDPRYGGGPQVNEAALNAEIERRLSEQAGQQQAQSQLSAQQMQDANNDPAFGSLLRNFSMSDLNADPVYQSGLQFGLDEGTKGLNRQAAASGGLLSGATLKALTKYGNDYASTKAGDSYNRFNTNKQNTYNMLAGISGTGQTANAQVGSAGMNAGNNISASQIGLGNSMANNSIGVGNARAASMIGGANALSGGLSGAYNGYQQNQFVNRLLDGRTSGFNGFENAWEMPSNYTYGSAKN